MLIGVAGLLTGLIALVLAVGMWRNVRREVRSLRGGLRDGLTQAVESRQAVNELETVASDCVRACRETAAAAERSAEASAESARASVGSARSAESAVQAALRAAAAAEAAATAAAQSAQACAQTAQSNRALAELGMRAWVHATEFRASLKTQGTENSTLEVRIANLGSTPARELKVSTNFHIEDAVPEELSLKPRANNIVLGPGVSFAISHFLRVSPADLAAISTGRRVLLACGQADYVDVLGVARQTRWCAVYNVNGNSFSPAAKHNLTA